MVTDKPFSTPVTSTPARWVSKVGNDEIDDKRKRPVWTEVKKKQHEENPFAGMKSCVDYEQEIERLKQIVPKVDTKRRSPKYQSARLADKKSDKPVSFNSSDIISRSTSPDTAHSSDMESVSDHSYITEEEKARFLAFVRNWTGDWKGGWGNHGSVDDLDNNDSLWADQSPWNSSVDRRQNYLTSAHLRNYDPLVISMPDKSLQTDGSTCQPETNDLYWQWKPQDQYLYWHPQHHSPQKYPVMKSSIGMGRSAANGRTSSPYGVFVN